MEYLTKWSLPVAPLIFGFVYFTNQPQDSYIFSFAACPTIPRRAPCVCLYRRPTISFVFYTFRFIPQFQVCSSSSPGSAPYIRVRLLYQSASRLLHILFCSLPQNPSSPTVSLALPSSHHLFCI